MAKKKSKVFRTDYINAIAAQKISFPHREADIFSLTYCQNTVENKIRTWVHSAVKRY